jgi:hypothetical protein
MQSETGFLPSYHHAEKFNDLWVNFVQFSMLHIGADATRLFKSQTMLLGALMVF